jgi:hypothetical protein
MAFDSEKDTNLTPRQLALKEYERAMEEYVRLLRIETTIRTGTPQAQSLTIGFRRMLTPGIYEHYKSTLKKPRQYAVKGIQPTSHGGPFVVYVRPYDPRKKVITRARSPDSYNWMLTGDRGFMTPVKKEYPTGGNESEPELSYAGPRLRLIRKLLPGEIDLLFAYPN